MNNLAFVENEIGFNTTDIVESSVAKGNNSPQIIERMTSRDRCSFSSEYDLVDTEYANEDLSTDVLKLQLYDELVQRFGPDEEFSEMLRSQGHKHCTLERIISNGDITSKTPSKPMTASKSHVDDSKIQTAEKVELTSMLMSQIPETHRSSYRSLIISPNNH